MRASSERLLKEAEMKVRLENALFVVYQKGYTTEHEDCLPPADQWIHQANFRPQVPIGEILFDEALIWRLINTGRHVLISGSAGSGKSHLIKRFLEHCTGAEFRYRITAPTASAAMLIGGETIHSALKCGLASESVDQLYSAIYHHRQTYRQQTWEFLTRTQLLVIDEISMVQPSLFRKLDQLMRQARAQPNVSFGGCILVMMGDFTQLGPIEDKDSEETAKFVFQTDTWKSLHTARLYLDRNYRQGEGEFARLLERVRTGTCTAEDISFLSSRANAELPPPISIDLNLSDDCSVCTLPLSDSSVHRLQCGHVFHLSCITEWVNSQVANGASHQASCPLCRGSIHPETLIHLELSSIRLYARVDDVDKYNKQKLNDLLLKGLVKHELRSYINVVDKNAGNGSRGAGENAHLALRLMEEAKKFLTVPANFNKIEQQYPVDRVFTVTVGAQVMMRSNRYVDRYICNGSVGLVTAISDNIVTVVFETKLGSRLTLEVERIPFDVKFKQSIYFQIIQYPLTLAWASTIHKSQGATFERLDLDARRCFAPGQLYVALSRVRTPEGLRLIGFDAKSIKTDTEAVEFELLSQEKRDEHRHRYENGFKYPVIPVSSSSLPVLID